jgi:hypothetical protein
MSAPERSRTLLSARGLGIGLLLPMVIPHFTADRPKQQVAAVQDGQRDFDFEIGRWTTQLRRLQRPLSGSATWVEYSGTTVVRNVWDGRATLVELDVTGPAGRIEGSASASTIPKRGSGASISQIAPPALLTAVIGGIQNGRGEFFGQELAGGRAILVRFIIRPSIPIRFSSNNRFRMMAARPDELDRDRRE